MRELCRRDVLFFVNAFVWQFNPNALNGKGVQSLELGPFVTFPKQDEVLRELAACVEGRRDALLEKSREMGASVCCLLLFLWYFLFHPRKKFLVMSRNEDLVDSSDPDSLFWKLDFILRHLPEWLTPKIKRLKLSFENLESGSFITGTASTGQAGVGGRATAMFIDEFSQIREAREVLDRTSNTTHCRIFNGTHKGVGTAFHELATGAARTFLKKIVMHWSHHPDKFRGAYSWDASEQKIVVHDPDYDYPPDFEFVKDGTPAGGPYPGLRSPYYDEQCKRKSGPRAVAEDLDIDAKGSQERVFDALLVAALRGGEREPVWVGDFLETGAGWRFAERAEGRWKLWRRPTELATLPRARYCVGADIATGSGATPSCVTVGDADTGEKVAEYSSPHIEPTPLAQMIVPLCRALVDRDDQPALLCWETPGPGAMFGKRVMEAGYRRVYYRTQEDKLKKVETDIPGWHNQGGEVMLALILEYRDALRRARFVNRSKEALDELADFRYRADGYVEHAGIAAGDSSGARVNHGDRVVADALCCKMMAKLAGSAGPEPGRAPADPVAAMKSLGYRKLLAAQKDAEQGEWA